MLATSLAPVVGLVSVGVAMALKAESPSLAPLFKQERIGRGGAPFNLFKFRTFERANDKGRSRGYHDERATRVGKFLRITTLDEAPQLLNILRGDMSVVGPRPLVERDIEHMKDTLSCSEFTEWSYAYTHCRPGWVNDYGTQTHRPTPLISDTYFSRAESDVHYFQHASAERDIQVIKRAVVLGPLLLQEATAHRFSINI